MKSPQGQGKSDGVEEVGREFEAAWKNADVRLDPENL